ncbi:MAG: hypothetical protein QW270_08670 [Candidatus Bathyarchaeia archaeon]
MSSTQNKIDDDNRTSLKVTFNSKIYSRDARECVDGANYFENINKG